MTAKPGQFAVREIGADAQVVDAPTIEIAIRDWAAEIDGMNEDFILKAGSINVEATSDGGATWQKFTVYAEASVTYLVARHPSKGGGRG